MDHGLGPGFQIRETASFLNGLPPDLFGLDWGEDAMLSQVLAASQQEYLDSLKEKEKKEDNEKNEEMEISENKEVVITSEAKEEQNSEQGPSASSAQS